MSGSRAFAPATVSRAPGDGGKDLELARPEHLDGDHNVVLEELLEVEFAGKELADIELGHQPKLPHPSKPIDTSIGRLVEHGHRGGLGLDIHLLGDNLQHIHDAGDVNTLGTAGRAGFAGSADRNGPRMKHQVRLPKLASSQHLVGRKVKVGCHRATSRTLLALVTQEYVFV